MSSESSPATIWSLAFVAELVRSGVQHVVSSPGSRSQALALAADAISHWDGSDFHVHVCIDERTAGFFGLGLAVQARQPVALLCTSGSAPAHYLPALLEAKHSGIPLIALTADRPEELRGIGANQTTKQVGMFGHAVHTSVEVPAPSETEGLAEEARGYARDAVDRAQEGAERGRPGPVHLNVAFREPLSSPISFEQAMIEIESFADIQKESVVAGPPRVVTLDPEPGTVVIAGHLAGPEAEQLAQDLGAVLIAEVHSGARYGKNLVVLYRELLETPPQGQEIKRVVCVGRPTLARQTQRILSQTDVQQVVWQRGEPEPSNFSGTAHIVDEVRVSRLATDTEAREWVSPWVTASRAHLEQKSVVLEPPAPDVGALASDMASDRARFAEQEMSVVRKSLTRRDTAREVWEHTWPGDQLILGSSRMIREFDRLVPGKKIPVWSNRGLSGIDGTIATARGFASGRSHAGLAGITRVVLGDLALLHDAGSLLLQDSERDNSRLQVLVVVDGGGSLFDSLEVAETTTPDAYERVIFTPSHADLESLATAYGWSYRKAQDLGGLIEGLADTSKQLLIECPVERAEP